MELAVDEGKTIGCALGLSFSKELLEGLETGDTVNVSFQELTQSSSLDSFTNGRAFSLSYTSSLNGRLVWAWLALTGLGFVQVFS